MFKIKKAYTVKITEELIERFAHMPPLDKERDLQMLRVDRYLWDAADVDRYLWDAADVERLVETLRKPAAPSSTPPAKPKRPPGRPKKINREREEAPPHPPTTAQQAPVGGGVVLSGVSLSASGEPNE